MSFVSLRVFLTTLALSAGVFAACSSGSDEQTARGRAYDEEAAPPDSGVDAGPRRVCPSASRPDGGWITVDGIDTSDYELTDWDEVRAKQPSIQYAILRVSASILRVDTRFHSDWPEVKRVGLLRGAYQFLSPRFSAVAQADLFLQRIHDEGGLLASDLPPVIDVETTNDLPADAVVCKIKVWLAKVEQGLGRVPMIYTSAPFTQYFGPEMKRYPLWVANYVATPSVTCPRMPDAWDKWSIWQYGGGTVKGVYSNGDRDGGGSKAIDDAGAPVLAESDMDYFDGTRVDLDALVAGSVSTGPVPDPQLPAHPVHVPTPDGGAPPDCSDGCCVTDP